MGTIDRLIIEKIKSAESLTLVIGGGELTLDLKPNKKLYHDIALAYQSAVVNARNN